ncbi:HESO1-like protein [Drosera capensis]
MDVAKRAKQLEEQTFLTNRSLFPLLYAFTDIIDDFYNLHRPTSRDYESRRDLICMLNIIAKEAYGNEIECDISVENRDGIAKSQIVLMICAIDERFQKLCFVVKAWAKSQDINSSKALVAFHLQRRDPPILPPFSEIFKDETDPPTVNSSIPKFLNYGRRNNESLAELFLTFLIRVEDFTIRSLNFARALSPPKMKKINQCFYKSVLNIHAFLNGKLDRSQLTDRLFGMDQDVKSKSVRKFDSIESKKPAAGAAKWKRLKKGDLSTAPSGSGIRYDSLIMGNGSGNPIFSSNRNEYTMGNATGHECYSLC